MDANFNLPFNIREEKMGGSEYPLKNVRLEQLLAENKLLLEENKRLHEVIEDLQAQLSETRGKMRHFQRHAESVVEM